MRLTSFLVLVLGVACICLARRLPDASSPTLERRGRLSGLKPEAPPKVPEPPAKLPPPKPRPAPKDQTEGQTGVQGGAAGQAKDHIDPFNSDGGDFVKEVALKALDAFTEVADSVWGGSDETATATSTVSTMATKALQDLLTTATAGTADDLTYYAVADLGLPSFDNAQYLAQQGLLANWSFLLTPAEYTMYQQSPLCYMANIEGMYFQAYEQSLDETSAVWHKRSTDTWQTSSVVPATGKSKRDEAMSDMYAYMYEYVLPWHILYLHMADPIVAGSATAVVVSTTSCAGLDGINGGSGVVTSFRKYDVAQTTPPTTSNSVPTGTVHAASSVAERLVPHPVLMLVVIALAGSWARALH
jgi:hypothetical protein